MWFYNKYTKKAHYGVYDDVLGKKRIQTKCGINLIEGEFTFDEYAEIDDIGIFQYVGGQICKRCDKDNLSGWLLDRYTEQFDSIINGSNERVQSQPAIRDNFIQKVLKTLRMVRGD